MRSYQIDVTRPNRPKSRALVHTEHIRAEDDASATVLALRRCDEIAKGFARQHGLLRAAALGVSVHRLRAGTLFAAPQRFYYPGRLVFDSLRDGPP